MADNEHMSREDQIAQWISKEDLRKKKQRERRKKIIPSSTDSITHTPVGDPLDALASVARWFGDHPELPTVDMGLIKENEIKLTFNDPQELDHPFQFQSNDGGSHWTITHDDALSLDTGNTYGWQTAALTAIGNDPRGNKMLLNTNRFHLMGLAGLDQFISGIMIGQVMEQATEPWTAEHHIWLVGFREIGPKLVNFLTMYHDESYFHLVETVEQITADDIKGTTATLYVKNSNAASLEAYRRIRADNPDAVGMFTDSVVTERAMFISENDDGTGEICNAAPDTIPFFPNIVDENHQLYLAMEMYWDKHLKEAEQARQAAESLTIEDFLPAATEAEPEETPTPAAQERTGATSISNISAEDLEAMFNSGTAERDTPEPAETELVREPAEEPAEQIPAPTTAAPEVEAEPAAVQPVAAYAPLALLGQPTLHSADGSLVTGKPAEAVAYLHLSGLTRESVDVAQAVWPEHESEGNAARVRRSRAAKAIKDALPETFRAEESRWILDPLTTDLDQILTALTSDEDPQGTVRACEAIQAPLQGCAVWADEPRAQIVNQLREVLEGVMDRALDHDQFEIVKAVRQAIKKL